VPFRRVASRSPAIGRMIQWALLAEPSSTCPKPAASAEFGAIADTARGMIVHKRPCSFRARARARRTNTNTPELACSTKRPRRLHRAAQSIDRRTGTLRRACARHGIAVLLRADDPDTPPPGNSQKTTLKGRLHQAQARHSLVGARSAALGFGGLLASGPPGAIVGLGASRGAGSVANDPSLDPGDTTTIVVHDRVHIPGLSRRGRRVLHAAVVVPPLGGIIDQPRALRRLARA
jgi:hypothetical protein